jgi:hypothetical protein
VLDFALKVEDKVLEITNIIPAHITKISANSNVSCRTVDTSNSKLLFGSVGAHGLKRSAWSLMNCFVGNAGGLQEVV